MNHNLRDDHEKACRQAVFWLLIGRPAVILLLIGLFL